MPSLRTISQTGKEAQWKKDKQILLSSLEDFQFFTFADLDFMNREGTVIASFENFSTEELESTGTLYGMVDDDEALIAPGTENRIRVYYNPEGTDFSDIVNPIIGGGIIWGEGLNINIWKEGDYGSIFPGYDAETLKKIDYPIHQRGLEIRQTVDFELNDCIMYGGGTTITHPLTDNEIQVGFVFTVSAIGLTSTVASITSSTEFEIDDVIDGSGAIQEVGTIQSGIDYFQHYVILKNHLDDENGIQWTDDFLDIDLTGYQWRVLQSPIYDEDVTINDARFLKIDKQFRGEL